MKEVIITVDLEEWFQVENLRKLFPYHKWNKEKIRCKKNVMDLLELFEKKKIRATFFVLSWIAERLPNLIREIRKRGHEIASHGYYHTMLTELSYERLKDELIKSKLILEEILQEKIFGYRAPNFSINEKILKLIHKAGYLYDSSYNSFRLNRRYGRLKLPSSNKNIYRLFDKFYEIPISNLSICGLILPWGGGACFRMIPFKLFIAGVRYILKKNKVYVFYIHPWEIDPYQPIPKGISFQHKIRHTFNLKNTYKKLSLFLEHLKDCSFLTCIEYIWKYA